MHAYLIVGGSSSIRSKKLDLILKTNKTKPLEFSVSKISETKELTKFLSLSQPENTAIIIQDIEDATHEALNAFLKTLEEPPKNVTFYITAGNETKILPTIVSRCQIIRVPESNQEINSDITDKEIADRFIKAKTGERLLITSQIRKREDAIIFTLDLIRRLHQRMTGEVKNYRLLAGYLTACQETYDHLNMNGNVTLQLTSLIVKLDNLALSDSMDKV